MKPKVVTSIVILTIVSFIGIFSVIANVLSEPEGEIVCL